MSVGRNEPILTLTNDFARVGNLTTDPALLVPRGGEKSCGLTLRPSRWLPASGLASSRLQWNFDS